MNNKGFATLSLLFFLPFVFILSFGSLWSLWLANQKNKINNICFQGATTAQEILVDGNNKLVSLNSVAKSLSTRKALLTAALFIAAPPQKPLLYRQRRLIIAKQKILKKQQTAILLQTNLLSKREALQTRGRLKKVFNDISLFWIGKKSHQPLIKIQWKNSQIKKVSSDIAGIYKRLKDHSQKQTLKILWRDNLRARLPQWLTNIVPIHPYWQSACASHPHQGGKKWISSIGEGKHLSKPLSSVFF